jgi:hypothetical protein
MKTTRSSSKVIKPIDYMAKVSARPNGKPMPVSGESKKSSSKKPVAKVKTSKEAKVAKKASRSSIKKDKPAPVTKGPNATHAINADNGKPVKLSASAKKANAAYYEKNRPATQPAVNLDEPTFTPKTTGPRNKGGKK